MINYLVHPRNVKSDNERKNTLRLPYNFGFHGSVPVDIQMITLLRQNLLKLGVLRMLSHCLLINLFLSRSLSLSASLPPSLTY